MKPVMTHPPTKSSRTEDVTHPLRADLAPLDHFSSMGALTGDSAPIPTMHDHHIHYSPELVLIAPIRSHS
jgi:hypothetical protein